jgi:hypothetical protein
MQRSSLIQWRIAALVGGFAFVSYLQRMNISVAAELMMPGLGLTKIQMGQIFSSFADRICDLSSPSGQARRFSRTESDIGSCSFAVGHNDIPDRASAQTDLRRFLRVRQPCDSSIFARRSGGRDLSGRQPSHSQVDASKRAGPWKCLHDRRELIGGCSYLAAGFVADASRWLAFGFLRYIGICICHGRAVVLGCDEQSG